MDKEGAAGGGCTKPPIDPSGKGGVRGKKRKRDDDGREACLQGQMKLGEDLDSPQVNANVLFVSFSHKVGVPLGLDMYFDVRSVKADAYKVTGYKQKTGMNPELASRLWEDENAQKVYEATKHAVLSYISTSRLNFKSLSIGIGCKSGQHRSVAMAERLCEDFKKHMEPSVVDARHLDAFKYGTSVAIDNSDATDYRSSYKRTSRGYMCSICKVNPSTAEDMNTHLQSKRHRKRLRKRSSLGWAETQRKGVK